MYKGVDPSTYKGKGCTTLCKWCGDMYTLADPGSYHRRSCTTPQTCYVRWTSKGHHSLKGVWRDGVRAPPHKTKSTRLNAGSFFVLCVPVLPPEFT